MEFNSSSNTLFCVKEADTKPRFIQSVFEITSDKVLTSIATKTGFDKDAVKTVQIPYDYDGTRFMHFPNAHYDPTKTRNLIKRLRGRARSR